MTRKSTPSAPAKGTRATPGARTTVDPLECEAKVAHRASAHPA